MRLSRADVGSRESEAVARIIAGGFLGMGPEVRAFEEELSRYLGAPTLCTHTGTSALQLALEAIGIGAGDEVLVPSLTYVASAQAILAAGAAPVLCEVQSDGTLDLLDAAARVTTRTRAVMPVHYAGNVGLRLEVPAFADARGLWVVEDAAHAFGSTSTGLRSPSHPKTVVCWSFDGIKNLTSGEGGGITTRDDRILARVRSLRVLGIENSEGDFDVSQRGWRYHMSDVMAAIGRIQLARFELELAPARRALAARYRERLAGVAGLEPMLPADPGLVPHVYPIRLRERDRVARALVEAGIEVGRHYKPLHRLSIFAGSRLPATDAVWASQLTLPLHPRLTLAEVERVCRVLATASA